MKNLPIYTAAIFISAFSSNTTAMEAEETLVATDSKRLVLALDTEALARYLNRTDTYTAQYGTYKSTEATTTLSQINIDAASKKFKKASKAFKRLTSIRYKNGQKIRAKIGKSSLTLKYTRPL